jgi:glycosyltransferase involved in cell wall biosynthesis
MKLSIILPALNEASGIAATLTALQPLREAGHELIVVDGGSSDATALLASVDADQVITSRRGRALQMNAGAAAASGDALLFLHADTRLPQQADSLIQNALQDSLWGRFDVEISGRRRCCALSPA